MPPEPPDGYVAFVERHLAELRREAARVVGDERDADKLYPAVLTDVAARWRWLDLRHRLRQPQAGERYLRLALARRSQHWRAEQMFPVEVQVWRPDAPAPAGYAQAGYAQAGFGPASAGAAGFGQGGFGQGGFGQGGFGQGGAGGRIEVRAAATSPAWSSVALRLAAHVTPASRIEVGPVAEAAVAWWHAYEAHRRRRFYAALAVLFVVMLLLAQFQRTGG
jgi:hypothetical protein